MNIVNCSSFFFLVVKIYYVFDSWLPHKWNLIRTIFVMISQSWIWVEMRQNLRKAVQTFLLHNSGCVSRRGAFTVIKNVEKVINQIWKQAGKRMRGRAIEGKMVPSKGGEVLLLYIKHTHMYIQKGGLIGGWVGGDTISKLLLLLLFLLLGCWGPLLRNSAKWIAKIGEMGDLKNINEESSQACDTHLGSTRTEHCRKTSHPAAFKHQLIRLQLAGVNDKYTPTHNSSASRKPPQLDSQWLVFQQTILSPRHSWYTPDAHPWVTAGTKNNTKLDRSEEAKEGRVCKSWNCYNAVAAEPTW